MTPEETGQQPEENAAEQARTESVPDVPEAPTATRDSTEGLRAEIEQLRQQVEKERIAADEYMKRWQRAQADLINYRKRVEQERSEHAQHATQALLARLLPLADDFDRAFQSLPRPLEQLTWIEGVFLIARRLQFLLEQEGVERIGAVGQPFNPLEHEAVMAEEGVAPGEGVVATVFQAGYRHHGRVLRPALVRVGRPSGEQDTAAEGETT